MSPLAFVGLAVAGGLGMYAGIGGLFEWWYYIRRRDRADEWKCQPTRWVHRWHHRNTTPTAFTSVAMHPLEFLTYQAITLAPLFVLPVHVGGAIAVLLYHNLVALVDHSGVKLRSWLPFQPPPQFHDDH